MLLNRIWERETEGPTGKDVCKRETTRPGLHSMASAVPCCDQRPMHPGLVPASVESQLPAVGRHKSVWPGYAMAGGVLKLDEALVLFCMPSAYLIGASGSADLLPISGVEWIGGLPGEFTMRQEGIFPDKSRVL